MKFEEIRNQSCDLRMGGRVTLGKNVILGSACKKISIGYGSFIGNDVYIDVEELSIGEYTTIHHGSVVHGKKTSIGHNCWFGHYTIIDSLGGETRIGNNVGVGAHSQLWSHMKFGDVLNGSDGIQEVHSQSKMMFGSSGTVSSVQFMQKPNQCY